MSPANKTVRQSVSLAAKVAAQVHSLAKNRRLSFNRMLVGLIAGWDDLPANARHHLIERMRHRAISLAR